MNTFNDRVNQDLITNILTKRGAEQAQVDKSRLNERLNEEKTLRELEEETKKQDIILKSGFQETMDRFKTKRTMASINTLLKRLKGQVANKRNITSELNSLLKLVDRDVQLDDDQKRNIVNQLQGLKLDQRGYAPSQTLKFVQLGNRIVEGLFDPKQSSLGTEFDNVSDVQSLMEDPRVNRGQMVDELMEQAYRSAKRGKKDGKEPTKEEVDKQLDRLLQNRLEMIADERMAQEIMDKSPPKATNPADERSKMDSEEVPANLLNIASLPSVILSTIRTADLDGLKDLATRMGVAFGHSIKEDTLRKRLLEHSESMTKPVRGIEPEGILNDINIANEPELRQLAKMLRVDLGKITTLDQMRHRIRQAIKGDLDEFTTRGDTVEDRTLLVKGVQADRTAPKMRELEQELLSDLEDLGAVIRDRENIVDEDIYEDDFEDDETDDEDDDDEEDDSGSHLDSRLESAIAKGQDMPSGIAGDGDDFMGSDEEGDIDLTQGPDLEDPPDPTPSGQVFSMEELRRVLAQRNRGQGKGVTSIKKLDKVVSDLAHELASMMA